MADIKADELSQVVMDALMDYSEKADKKVKRKVTKIAKEVLLNLQSNPNIPRSIPPKKTKRVLLPHYADSFKMKSMENSIGRKRILVYNEKYRIGHLLENGRSNGHPMRTFPHWRQAQNIADKLYNEICEELGNR